MESVKPSSRKWKALKKKRDRAFFHFCGLFKFTPLESPAACPVRSLASIGACSGDEDKFLLKRTRGLMPRVSRPVRRAKLF